MGYFANGTEGQMFEDAWCSRCVHSDISGDREPGVDPPCPVWMAHMLYAYDLCNDKEHPGKVILDMLIPDERPVMDDGLPGGPPVGCAMFHPIDAGAAIRGQMTLVPSTNVESRHLEAALPSTFYADRPLLERVEKLVAAWQRCIAVNAELEGGHDR